MGLLVSSACFWFLPVLCSERESRFSFFNRAAGGKRIFFGLRVVSARWWRMAKCRFFSVACRSACKKDPSLALGQACPGSEQEGPARVAQCPHKQRSGARGRCLFAHRGKPGWHSAAVFEQAASSRGHGSFRGLPDMSEPQLGVGEAGTAMSRARSTR